MTGALPASQSVMIHKAWLDARREPWPGTSVRGRMRRELLFQAFPDPTADTEPLAQQPRVGRAC